MVGRGPGKPKCLPMQGMITRRTGRVAGVQMSLQWPAPANICGLTYEDCRYLPLRAFGFRRLNAAAEACQDASRGPIVGGAFPQQTPLPSVIRKDVAASRSIQRSFPPEWRAEIWRKSCTWDG